MQTQTQTLLSAEVLINSRTGDKLIIVENNPKEASSQVLRMEAIFKPARQFAPEHYHPHQDEQFEVLSGKLMTRINGVIREYRAGEKFSIPRGVRHAMYNASTEDVHFSWQTMPALQTRDFFRRAYQAVNTGKVNRKGFPDWLGMLLLLKDFQQEVVITRIPLLIQKALFNCILPALVKK